MSKRGYTLSWILSAGTLACGSVGGDVSDDLTSDESETYAAATWGQTFRGTSDRVETGVFDTPYGPQTLTYVVEPDGTRVFQGDILLPSDRLDYRSGGVANFGSIWPNGIVRYESTGLFNDARVVAAINHWEARLPLIFVAGATTGNRLRFVSPSTEVCRSAVGMIGGAQIVELAPTCGTGAAIHEIGHAIGLFHEQSRNDRNNFVIINTGCIQAGHAHDFAVFGTAGIHNGPYDIESIMHYNSNYFLASTPGCTATITRLDGSAINLPRDALTGLDIAGASALYQYSFVGKRRPVDYDGDGKADVALWRPSSNGDWHIKRSSNGTMMTTIQYGTTGDVPVPGYYYGDVTADRAVWRPSTGRWHVRRTNGSTFSQVWGVRGDVPVPADYDGDGRTDLAVWRPSTGTWLVRQTTRGDVSWQWGQAGDVPVVGDYDGDGFADRAVWRPSTGWWSVIISSAGTVLTQQWGAPGDVPVPMRWDADSRFDFAVWRPSNGGWYIINSSNGTVSTWFGGARGDIPVPADYDGDGRADLSWWHPTTGDWLIHFSSSGFQGWAAHDLGQLGDAPVP